MCAMARIRPNDLQGKERELWEKGTLNKDFGGCAAFSEKTACPSLNSRNLVCRSEFPFAKVLE
jgi:hypothetical protein